VADGPRGSERARTALAFLRRNIASGEWPINSRIPREPDLMELLGVGKSTVREAVRSLANLGMLETLAGRGTFVRSRTPVSSVITEYVSDYDVREILVYRHALEIEACRQAAAHRTQADLATMRAAIGRAQEPASEAEWGTARESERARTPGPFHHLIFEASGNRLLPGLYAGVMAALRTPAARAHLSNGATAEQHRLDHAAILQAIEDRDADAAALAMAVHLDRDLVPVTAGA
jgi:DNA-binding FadR family transcriptional regulator